MATLSTLAATVQASVQTIDDYLTRRNLSKPSFAVDSPTELPLDASVQRARLQLIEAASSLANLAIGSADHLRWHCMNNKYDDMTLHFLTRFHVFDHVPLQGSISYKELAEKCGLTESRLRRVLSMAYTLHYFCEPEPGFVAHTSNSVVAANDPLAWAWVLHNFEEVGPWYANKFADATEKWGDSKDPIHTGPNLNATPGEEKGFVQIMEEDDQGEWNGVQGRGFRLWRLYDTDQFFGTGGAVKGTGILRAFDWKALGKATVVDMSGVTGHLSHTIALANPDLTFVVQERGQPWLEKQFNEKLPAELKGTGRVSFMAHDKYAEQPVKDAEAYFISTMLHKESDDQAITILRRLVEAMDPKKSRIITRDIVMDAGDPPPGDALINGKAIDSKEVYEAGLGPTGTITRLNAGIDLQMLAVMNAFERTRQEWIDVFQKADPRFVLKACIQTVGNCASVMEWALE